MCFQLSDFASACVAFRRSEGGSRDSGEIRRSVEHENMRGFCNDAATFKFVLLPSVADHCGDDRHLLTDIQSINIHLLIKFTHASFFLTSFFHSFIYFLSYYSF